jgi:hypothetical protein
MADLPRLSGKHLNSPSHCVLALARFVQFDSVLLLITQAHRTPLKSAPPRQRLPPQHLASISVARESRWTTAHGLRSQHTPSAPLLAISDPGHRQALGYEAADYLLQYTARSRPAVPISDVTWRALSDLSRGGARAGAGAGPAMKPRRAPPAPTSPSTMRHARHATVSDRFGDLPRTGHHRTVSQNARRSIGRR